MSMMAGLVVAALALTQGSVAGVSMEPLIAEAVVDAPVDNVWEAFTTKEGIESWMVASCDVDLRIGGLMRTTYRKAADLDGETAIHQRILSFDPGRMLSHEGCAAFCHSADPQHSVISPRSPAAARRAVVHFSG